MQGVETMHLHDACAAPTWVHPAGLLLCDMNATHATTPRRRCLPPFCPAALLTSPLPSQPDTTPQLEHILLRPDTYIGSTEAQEQQLWVHDGERMVLKNIRFVPGLYKIFDEILVNAADNKV